VPATDGAQSIALRVPALSGAEERTGRGHVECADTSALWSRRRVAATKAATRCRTPKIRVALAFARTRRAMLCAPSAALNTLMLIQF